MAPYYDLMAAQPYRARPHEAILQLLHRTLGRGRGTAQDSVKEAAAIRLGYARLTTKICHAKYIGDRGVHFNRALYEHHGFNQTELYPDPVFDSLLPSYPEIDAIVAAEDKAVRSTLCHMAVGSPGLYATVAVRARITLAPDRYLALAENGKHLVTTTQAEAALPLHVLTWEESPAPHIVFKSDHNRWVGLEDDGRLVLQTPNQPSVTFFRLPMSEPFYVIGPNGRAVVHRPKTETDPEAVQATTVHCSQATAFSIEPLT